MTGYCEVCGNTACICCPTCRRPDCACRPIVEPAADRLAEIGRLTAEEPTSWTGTLTVTYSARQSACVGCRVVGTWDEIAAHVLVCPDHPIGRLTRERDEARAELAALREACIREDSYGVCCSLCLGGGLEREFIDHDDDCILAAATPAPAQEGDE